jgi:hypothetical protein
MAVMALSSHLGAGGEEEQPPEQQPEQQVARLAQR